MSIKIVLKTIYPYALPPLYAHPVPCPIMCPPCALPYYVPTLYSALFIMQENVGEIPSSLCLVGNKLDLDLDGTNEREVSTETGETFAKVMSCASWWSLQLSWFSILSPPQIYNARFIEASAKTGCNVGDALLMIVGAIKSHHEVEEHKESTQHNQNSNITVSEPTESKCCSSS